jgi:peptidyl-prolyl cis-trans isomerase C
MNSIVANNHYFFYNLVSKRLTQICKSLKIVTFIYLVLALSSCTESVKNYNEQNNNNKDQVIISTYNEGEVTLQDINVEIDKIISQNSKLSHLTFAKLTAEQKDYLIKEITLKKIAYKEAKKRGLAKDKDYLFAIKTFESELLKQKLMLTLVKDATEEKYVRKKYQEIVKKIGEKKDIRIAYIVVNSEDEARNIYKSLLTSPNSFDTIAKKQSLDKETAKNGGDLGFVLEDILPEELVRQARNTPKGKFSKPANLYGKWFIIKFIDERQAVLITYEKIKDSLAKNLATKAVEDFIINNIEKAKIKIIVK